MIGSRENETVVVFTQSLSLLLSSSPAKWERASVARGVLCHQPPRLLRFVFQGKMLTFSPSP
jgi:hypothetical protein